MCMVGTTAFAYGCYVGGIYYNLNNTEKTAEVTYKDYNYNSYSGDVTIPETIRYNEQTFSVTSIGSCAFRGCSGLTSITIPNSVTSIGSEAFSRCSGLTSITIPNSVTSITDYAFYRCTGLTSVTIPNSVKTIGDGAFWGCSQLKIVTMFDNLNEISDNAFKECGIEEWRIKVSDYAAFCNNTMTSMISCGSNSQAMVQLIDKNGNNIKDYIIPNNVTSIGKKAFCRTNLTSVIIPNTVTNICDSAFYYCRNLESVKMGSGINIIGYDAFSECPQIKKVLIDDLAAWCNIDFTTKAYSSYYHDFQSSVSSNPIAARVAVEGLGSASYAGGGGATIYCEGEAVSNLIIPDGVTKIKPYAFAYGNFQKVTIPSSITQIYENAFCKCTKLKGVCINDLYAWCNINFITYSTYSTVWSRSSQEANPLMYAQDLYLNDKILTNLSIPSNVKQIRPYAFYNCSLESVVLPNGFTTIGESAFSRCKNLKSIVIPNTVTSIGKSAFSGCMSLYSVTSLINMPFNLDESVFQYTGTQYDKDIVYMAATLYVPRGRVPMYSSIQGWQKFLNIVETDTKFKLTYIVDGEEYKTYEIQATEVITPEPDPYKEGCIFSGWSEIPYLMPAHDVTVTGAFTIDTAIDQIMSNGKDDSMIYTIDGKRLSKPQRGLNIVRMSDGTVRKVMVK